MLAVVRHVHADLGRDARVPSIIIAVDRPLLVVRAPQQLLVLVLLGQFVGRDREDQVVDEPKTCAGTAPSRNCRNSLTRRVDALTAASTASRWRRVALTPSARS